MYRVQRHHTKYDRMIMRLSHSDKPHGYQHHIPSPVPHRKLKPRTTQENHQRRSTDQHLQAGTRTDDTRSKHRWKMAQATRASTTCRSFDDSATSDLCAAGNSLAKHPQAQNPPRGRLHKRCVPYMLAVRQLSTVRLERSWRHCGAKAQKLKNQHWQERRKTASAVAWCGHKSKHTGAQREDLKPAAVACTQHVMTGSRPCLLTPQRPH